METAEKLLVQDGEQLNELLVEMLNIGDAMYCAGGEISRIERTLHVLGKAYGARHVNVYALTSSIVLTVDFPGFPETTQTRRIKRLSMDLAKLQHLCDLCTSCMEKPIPVEQLRRRVEEIRAEKPRAVIVLIGEILAAASFAIFFGGGWQDAVAAGIIGAGIYVLSRYFKPLCLDFVFFNIVTSFLVGVITCLAGRVITTLQIDKIMIGDIMLLIPGIAITNSLRYTVAGDSISGVETFIDSVLQAAGIAAGFMIAMLLFR